MATETQTGPKTEPGKQPPTIHEVELASGASGAVEYGGEIDVATAVDRRKSGQDIVVRGDETAKNRKLARDIETAVGPSTRPQPPEPRAGPMALPHFHQQSRDPEGHSFYETDKRKARQKR